MSNTTGSPGRIPDRRPALQSIAGGATRRGQAPLAPLAARLPAPAGTLTVGTLRAVIAAADALRSHLAACPPGSVDELARPRGELGDLVHRYQTASRQCVREWLQEPRPTVWLVEAASGRVVDTTTEPVDDDGGVDATMQVALADMQPLHGLRERHTRGGIGVPVIVSRREGTMPRRAHALQALEVLARTAVVGVERGFDARVRSVRVRLLDPDKVDVVRLRGINLPLAADWTAAVAFLLGRERRPPRARIAEGGTLPRAGCENFTPLTPSGRGRTPLLLLEGAGLSPLMMAQVANEVAGTAALRARYAVWLYRYPMTAPLFLTASRLRADLERFARRFPDGAGDAAARAVVVAQGPSAVLARSLLVASGDALWDAVYSSNAELALGARDRARLEAMLRWQASPRVARVVAVNPPDNLAALVAGVGERAVQSLLLQPRRYRALLARLHDATGHRLRLAGQGTTRFTEPLHEAVYAATVAADRALLGLLADPADAPGAALYDAGRGASPVGSLAVNDSAPLGPQALRQLLAWLRQPSRDAAG